MKCVVVLLFCLIALCSYGELLLMLLFSSFLLILIVDHNFLYVSVKRFVRYNII